MVSLSYTCIIKQFSFADHATDAVLIHVSASSEREDWGSEAGPVT